MTSDPIAVALEVAAALEAHEIPYLIGGSVASTLYGEPRATLDVDFAVRLSASKVEPLAALLDSDFYVDRASIQDAVEHHRHFNLIHRKWMLKVDVYVRPEEGIFAEEMRRAKPLKLKADPDRYAFVATPEDTLLQKLRWYRLGDDVSDRQWRDVLGILKATGEELDHDYLDRWALARVIHDGLEQGSEIGRDLSIGARRRRIRASSDHGHRVRGGAGPCMRVE